MIKPTPTRRLVKLLHVEDNRVQQLIVAQFLKRLDDFDFAITLAANEEDAVAAFLKGGADLVILDYHLNEGDGLSVLRKIREHDAIVPVVALSGSATAEIAAQLVRSGADDYLSKCGITAEVLGQSVRAALRRTDAVRQRSTPSGPGRKEVESLLRQAADLFSQAFGADWLERFDRLEAAAREARMSAPQMQSLFHALAGNDAAMKSRLRPMFLELVFRLSGDSTDGAS